MHCGTCVVMEIFDRLKAARDRAIQEGYVATAAALDELLKNRALFEYPSETDRCNSEQTLG